MAYPPLSHRFVFLKRLGAGGRGEVFLVRDRVSGKQCALKRLATPSRLHREEIQREFRCLATIRHPTIVSVYECGLASDGYPYFTMEYVSGRPIDAVIGVGDVRRLAQAGAEIAHGLEVLHAAGIVHGDLKPSNIMAELDEGDVFSLRLVDFGLAASFGESATRRGSPGYVAPEVVAGDAIGVPSDLYALGSTLFTLACGAPTFRGATKEALITQQISASLDGSALERLGVPPAMIELILRLMAVEPGRRPRSATDVRRELERLLSDARPTLERRLEAAALVGRSAELEAVDSCLRQTRNRAQGILFVGPHGIGKSALLAEAARRAALGGHSVIVFSSAELDELLAGNSEEAASEALRSRLSPLRSEPRVPVVVVDDTNRLSPPTRSRLRQFLLAAQSPPSVWLMASDAEAGDEGSLLVSVDGLVRRTLPPIERASVGELVAVKLRELPPAELESALWNHAQGHPGAMIDMLRALAESGTLREDGAGLIVDRERLLQMEDGAREREGSVDQLSVDDRTAVTLVAMTGELSRSRFENLMPNRAETVDRLVRLGLMRVSQGALRLARPASADRLLEQCSPEEIAAMAGRLLEQGSPTDLDRVQLLLRCGRLDEAQQILRGLRDEVAHPHAAAAIARLLARHDPEEAAAWEEKIARQLFAAGRYEAAVAHLKACLDRSPESARRPERLLLLSTANLRTGETSATGAVLAELLASTVDGRVRAQALTNQCAYLRGIGEFEQSEAAGQSALRLAEGVADDESVAGASQMLALVLMSKGKHAQAEAMIETSLQAHRRTGFRLGEVRAQAVAAVIAQAQGQTEKALSIYASALDQARAGNLRLAVEELSINRGVLFGDLGQWAEARKHYAEAARIALADHRPRHAAVAYANLALSEVIVGDVRAGTRNARAAIRLAQRHLPSAVSFGWRVLAQAERYRGRLREARRASLRSLAAAKRRGSAVELGWCRLEHGAVLEASHRYEQALHAYLEAGEELPVGQPALRTMLHARAAIMAIQVRDAERTRILASPLPSEFEASPIVSATLRECEAMRSLHDGSAEASVEAAGAMVRAYAHLPAPAEGARGVLALATQCHEIGFHPAPYRDWLKWASSEFERLGDHRSRETALALLVHWLESEPRGRRNEDELLESISELLTSLPDLEQLSKKAMELVVHRLEAERGVFLVVEPTTGQLRSTAEYGQVDMNTRRHAIGYSRRVVRQVAKSGDSLLVDDASNDKRVNYESVAKLQLRSILCVPMYTAGRVVGAIYLDDSRRKASFSAGDQDLLERIAHLLAIAIDRSHAHEMMARTNEALMGENVELRQLAADGADTSMLGSSLAMRQILPIVRRAAETLSPVLLTGENGTGKELIARMIHANSSRRLQPFVVVNCGAIVTTLLESELFGILPNVATGVRGRPGAFREAEGGTLFLDEIGDMPLHQQVALLSVLASKELTPVGGGRPSKIDVRIIAATNRDLTRMVQSKEFREDLYFRLAVLSIRVPPLRDRLTDIPQLARHFASHVARLHKRSTPELSSEFLARLMRSEWPGNVRQLQNTIERVMALYPSTKLKPQMLEGDPDFIQPQPKASPSSLPEELDELECLRIRQALERARGNQSAAARELGIGEQRLRYRMEKHELSGIRRPLRKRRSLRKAT